MAGKKRAKKTKYPWDQQPEEPDAAYARFLVYRNLGPSRSIDAAYHSAGAINAEAKRSKAKRASSTWFLEASQWNWQARAEAWDVFMLLASGQRVVTRFIAALDKLS